MVIKIFLCGNIMFLATLLLLNREAFTNQGPQWRSQEQPTSGFGDAKTAWRSNLLARIYSIAATEFSVLAGSSRVTDRFGSQTPFKNCRGRNQLYLLDLNTTKGVFGNHHLTKNCNSHAKHLEIRPRTLVLQEVYRNGFINEVIIN